MKLQTCCSLDILCCFCRGGWFHSHGEERAKEQNSRAPKLRVSEPFVKDPSGERHRSGGTKQLEGLRERDSDFVYRHIIQNMSERDAGHSGNHENKVRVHACMDRRVDLTKGEGEGKKQR